MKSFIFRVDYFVITRQFVHLNNKELEQIRRVLDSALALVWDLEAEAGRSPRTKWQQMGLEASSDIAKAVHAIVSFTSFLQGTCKWSTSEGKKFGRNLPQPP